MGLRAQFFFKKNLNIDSAIFQVSREISALKGGRVSAGLELHSFHQRIHWASKWMIYRLIFLHKLKNLPETSPRQIYNKIINLGWWMMSPIQCIRN